MEPFWMVWSPSGNAPTFKHPTREDAQKEAERLFRKYPDQAWIVLEAVSWVAWAPESRPVTHLPMVEMPF